MTNSASIAMMTTAEVAAALGVSIKTVTRWVASERLTPVHRLPGLRGAMLFAAEDVEALRASRA